MSAKRLLEMTQAWHDCEVELKQLRVLLQVRDKQIEVTKGQITALQSDNRIMLNCGSSCSVQSVKDILIKNNLDIPFWPCHVLQVLGPKGIPKTGDNKYKTMPQTDG